MQFVKQDFWLESRNWKRKKGLRLELELEQITKISQTGNAGLEKQELL